MKQLSEPTAEALHRFADRVARFFEDNGLPRMAGRVLGHLLTCDPPAQTFDDMVQALGSSRSSISVATRLLAQLDLIERYSVAGERRDRYRIRADAWTMLLKQDMSAASQLKQLADEGLELVASKPPALAARLQAMRAFYVFLEDAFQPILAQWDERRAQLAAEERPI